MPAARRKLPRLDECVVCGDEHVGGGLSAAQVTVNISIAPALKSRLVSEAPLFVFAREPGSKGPPLAAKAADEQCHRHPSHLSAADSCCGARLGEGTACLDHRSSVLSGRPVPRRGLVRRAAL